MPQKATRVQRERTRQDPRWIYHPLHTPGKKKTANSCNILLKVNSSENINYIGHISGSQFFSLPIYFTVFYHDFFLTLFYLEYWMKLKKQHNIIFLQMIWKFIINTAIRPPLILNHIYIFQLSISLFLNSNTAPIFMEQNAYSTSSIHTLHVSLTLFNSHVIIAKPYENKVTQELLFQWICNEIYIWDSDDLFRTLFTLHIKTNAHWNSCSYDSRLFNIY